MQTVTFLLDVCGSNAVTAATLEEDITLRIYFNDGFASNTMKKATGGGGGGTLGKGGMIQR